AYGPQNDVTLKMPAFEWVHVQLHQQKGMISLSPPTICNSASTSPAVLLDNAERLDKLVNGSALTEPDRAGVNLDTWRGMMAKNDEVR
ncbi:hypothetical protein JTM17_33455, partial [Pseudomonas aeruginosa]|nr:hypothetical protein [Pseudomonas aeruginosa]